MLRLAGIDIADVGLTYLHDAQWPGDDYLKALTKEPADETCMKAPGNNGWFLPEFTMQLARLQAELEAWQPSIIVPMGSLVLWAFTGVANITEARGSMARATKVAPNLKILPTFRPGYVLRQYKMRGTVIADLKKALAESRRPAETMKLSRRELWVEPTAADCEDFLERYLRPAKVISCDIETARGQITCIGFGASAQHAISVPFVDFRSPSRSYWATSDAEEWAWDFVQEVFDLPQPKLFQNGPYDTFYLIREGLGITNWRYDTRLLHHALYPELPKSLAYMGSVYTFSGPWKLLGSHLRNKRDE